MAERRIVLVDDPVARRWEPFALTRPIGELRSGAWTTRERVEAVLEGTCVGHLTSAHLASFDEPWAPPVLGSLPEPSDGGLVVWQSRAVPALGTRIEFGDEPAWLTIGGVACGWYAPPGGPAVQPDWLEDPQGGGKERQGIEVRGRLLRDVWELVTHLPDQLHSDVAFASNVGRYDGAVPLSVLDLRAGPEVPGNGVHVLGDGPLRLGEDVEIEPTAVLDLRAGGIVLERGVRIRAGARLAGPCWIGADTHVLGGSLDTVATGPRCRVRGEVETSLLQGYVNKAHHGFVGHSVLGMWVNLGALTTTSDLKNNYSSVRVWTPEGERDTGERKVGSFLGDHVKTAIGTLLPTGATVGAGASLFEEPRAPRDVPPFSWGGGAAVTRLEDFLATAETVMGRRDVELTENGKALLSAAWQRATGDLHTA
ncbi:MAG TPA: putative sugar nucleotidyl transferase [Longimicrobiales bacterium]|nr:putative sugar nucleotidyl transferase [Longimicrobiales bacterium]